MLSENKQSNTEDNIEFFLERPIGWSSACLDFTINYYLNCDSQDPSLEENIDLNQCES